MSAPAWRQALNKSLDSNKHLKYSQFFQLATVRPDGRPSNRTVAFRGFLEKSDRLTFTTDTRWTCCAAGTSLLCYVSCSVTGQIMMSTAVQSGTSACLQIVQSPGIILCTCVLLIEIDFNGGWVPDVCCTQHH